MIARRRLTGALAGLVVLALAPLVPRDAGAHDPDAPDAPAERLSTIGAAPDFTLMAQDRSAVSLADLRGKVVALNFIFTSCLTVCPIASFKMADIQDQLGEQFGRDVYFVSVTVDPEHDTPEVLADYAEAVGCDLSGWAFLTGSAEAVKEVARSYGAYSEVRSDGVVIHSLLTTLIDRNGMIRVQYLGEQFDPAEMLHDLRDLAAEAS